MRISGNQFTRQSFNTKTGSFTTFLKTSANTFTNRVFLKSVNTFQGDNTTESAYGVDDMFGGPNSTYGETPYNGIDHFKLRPKYDITR